MNEIMNAETAEEQATNAEALEQEEQERTFTQDDVNRIVQERLSRERERINSILNEDESIKKELAAERLKLEATKELARKGLPLELVQLVDCSSKENYDKSMESTNKMYELLRKKIVRDVFVSHGRTIQNGASSSPRNLDNALHDTFQS